jgi:hypothetical protein
MYKLPVRAYAGIARRRTAAKRSIREDRRP